MPLHTLVILDDDCFSMMKDREFSLKKVRLFILKIQPTPYER